MHVCSPPRGNFLHEGRSRARLFEWLLPTQRSKVKFRISTAALCDCEKRSTTSLSALAPTFQFTEMASPLLNEPPMERQTCVL